MSMTLTRSPLQSIGMNGAGVAKRRSARLSAEGLESDGEPPAKRTRITGAQHTTTVTTKEQDGVSNAVAKKRGRVYNEEVDEFAFSRGKKVKATKPNTSRNPATERTSPVKPPPAPKDQQTSVSEQTAAVPVIGDAARLPAHKRIKKRFPTTPEREAAEKPIRRSKRLSSETTRDQARSPHKVAHAKSHANQAQSPSPFRARPITVEKTRKRGEDGMEEQKTMRIQLPFADTPVIRRNIEMRKASAENGSRRSSSGMRGRRASSLIDEGRGNALPHSKVSTAEFYKHISAELTEPRRMRCLLGWCGTRALPPKPEAPKDKTASSHLEFQALQAARVIQEELCQDLTSRGVLSDWFSRDESAPPQIPLRKKPNPRNVANAAKAEELERELERLTNERAEWDELIASAAATSSPRKDAENMEPLSPVNADLLDSPQRAVLEQLQAPTTVLIAEPEALQQRLRNISNDLEFSIDQFAHGVHALNATNDTAEHLADRTLAESAEVLAERDRAQRISGKAVDTMEALKGLARVLNGRQS